MTDTITPAPAPTLDDLLCQGNDILTKKDATEAMRLEEWHTELERSWDALCRAAKDSLGPAAAFPEDDRPDDFATSHAQRQIVLAFHPFGAAPLSCTFHRPAFTGEDVAWQTQKDRSGHGPFRVPSRCTPQWDQEQQTQVPAWTCDQPTASLAEAVALCHRAEALYLDCLSECQHRNDLASATKAQRASQPKPPTTEERLLAALACWLHKEFDIRPREEDDR